MEFVNKGYWEIPLPFGLHLVFNDTIFSTLVIGLGLCVFAVIVRVKLKRFADVPGTRFQNVVELMVETMHNFTVSNMTEKFAHFGGWFFGLFAFIILSNLSGLIGLRPPTADLATTLVFGMSTWILIQFMGLKHQKLHFFKEFVEPIPLFLPIHLVSAIAPLISLSFRMFGNILGGCIIMGLVYGLFPWFLKLGIPSVLHIYFDVFAGSLQAFIFVMLSMVFITSKAGE